MDINGGDIIASIFHKQGVRFVFTLCGGHISPVLTGCKKHDIAVIDMRHEASALFAADAAARLTGVPGVAVVTAGPGVTNSITAIKNAQMAQSPVVIIGGAAATVLKGRGSLQDIDQISMIRGIVKKAFTIKRNCDLVPVVEEAFISARSGVPGPVFIECPIDTLYAEKDVRAMYGVKSRSSRRHRLWNGLLDLYLRHHIDRIFSCDFEEMKPHTLAIPAPTVKKNDIDKAIGLVRQASRPVMIIGSQALLYPHEADRLVVAVEATGIPVYFTGMARGLLGKSHALQFRHRRTRALNEADLVILAGMPCDFRLDYGLGINADAVVVSINRSKRDLYLNIRPDVAVRTDPFLFLCALGNRISASDIRKDREEWFERLTADEKERDGEIEAFSRIKTEYINPVVFLKKLESFLDERALLIADGGDFVGAASYILRPRSPLSWLDPGVFGTLGVGGGFAVGAKLCRPDSEVWLLYGDGSAGYSIVEFDTLVRHNIPVIAVIGNDAGWTQIARDQVTYLGDDVATGLRYSDYHRVADALGARGLLLDREDRIDETLQEARALAGRGHPVLINVLIGKTDFRKGSISV